MFTNLQWKGSRLGKYPVFNLHSQPNYGSNYLSTNTMTAVTCKALPSATHKGEHRSPGETLNNQMQWCDHQIKCNVISLCNQSMRQALLSPSFVVHRPLLVLSGHELVDGVFPPGLILQVRWVVAIWQRHRHVCVCQGWHGGLHASQVTRNPCQIAHTGDRAAGSAAS